MATDSGINVFYCGENIFFTLNLSVPGIIIAHDSMITIKNGGNTIYGPTLVTPLLVRRLHLEKLISNTLALIHN